MASSTTIANSTLTQDDVQRILIMPLQQRSTYLQQGFPTFVSNGEPIKVPSLTNLGTATFVAQGSAIPELSATTSEITLLASTVRATKVIARMSNELVRQSVVNVESAFSMKLVNDVSTFLDNALWNGGTATAGSPIGMVNFTGNVNAGTAAGTAITANTLYDMHELAMEKNLSDDSLRWAMSPGTFTRIRKLTDNYGARILQPSLAEGAPPTLLGQPYTVTNHVPDTALLLFDRSQIAVGMDQRASITLLTETYANYDEVAVRVTARYDTAKMNDDAVVRLTIT
jgi:HK97 family phage major capsid protein